ncbi:atrial natriuretic peptide receptor 3-like [Babylonia areolata]|uniref:atrial natriuretic peptide receptor 3-like n=1 Tax=Babylonia areolata TaxID=304850 RepID=UPI003FD06D9F
MAPATLNKPVSPQCCVTGKSRHVDSDSSTSPRPRKLHHHHPACYHAVFRTVTQSLLLFSVMIASMQGCCVQGKGLPPGRKIHLAALLPTNSSRFPFAYQKVLPALKLSVDNVTARGGVLHGRDIQVHFRDSECSSAAAMNQMYNFYIQKQVDVFFGPCCDYAAAPVGRQLHYWNLPMLTAGAIASDFAAGKRKFFNLITRVGASVNSLVDCLLAIMQKFRWKRIKQVYDPIAQDLIGEKVCHIMADGIHYGLKYQSIIPDIEQDYEKVDVVDHFLDRMPEEIGDWGTTQSKSEGRHKHGRPAKIGYRPPELGVEVRTPRPGLLPCLLTQGAVLGNMVCGLVSLAAIT